MRAGEDTEPYHVHILLQGCFYDHLRCLPDPRIDHLHTGISQRPRDDLGAPVVAIQARLCDQHPDIVPDAIGLPPRGLAVDQFYQCSAGGPGVKERNHA